MHNTRPATQRTCAAWPSSHRDTAWAAEAGKAALAAAFRAQLEVAAAELAAEVGRLQSRADDEALLADSSGVRRAGWTT
jgi:hypothetical protein